VDEDDVVRLQFAAESLEVAPDGGLTAVARNTLGGEEASFAFAIAGGLQPSRLAGEVNPLAHVAAEAVTLRSLGEPTGRFLQAAAAALRQEGPPIRSRWRKLFDREKPATSGGHEIRFAALLVTREGDVTQPRALHLKLYCEGGELYLDVDVERRRVTLVEKDPEFRAAVWRALAPLLGPA
jgi:hypothetical protein